MAKKRIQILVLGSLAIFTLLGIGLYACSSSDQQKRQITNAFTPGQSNQNTTLQAQTPTHTETDGATAADQHTMLPNASAQASSIPGQPIVVTQTRATLQPNQPGATPTPINNPVHTATTSGSTQTATRTPTKTTTATATTSGNTQTAATPTLAPTLQTGWEGEWTFYRDDGTGSYIDGTLSVTLTGNEILANALINGSNYEFVGQLSPDGSEIRGDYTNGTSSGWFYWVYLSDSQFGGTLDNDTGFCASRNGADKPGQCGYFLYS